MPTGDRDRPVRGKQCGGRKLDNGKGVSSFLAGEAERPVAGRTTSGTTGSCSSSASGVTGRRLVQEALVNLAVAVGGESGVIGGPVTLNVGVGGEGVDADEEGEAEDDLDLSERGGLGIWNEIEGARELVAVDGVDVDVDVGVDVDAVDDVEVGVGVVVEVEIEVDVDT